MHVHPALRDRLAVTSTVRTPSGARTASRLREAPSRRARRAARLAGDGVEEVPPERRSRGTRATARVRQARPAARGHADWRAGGGDAGSAGVACVTHIPRSMRRALLPRPPPPLAACDSGSDDDAFAVESSSPTRRAAPLAGYDVLLVYGTTDRATRLPPPTPRAGPAAAVDGASIPEPCPSWAAAVRPAEAVSTRGSRCSTSTARSVCGRTCRASRPAAVALQSDDSTTCSRRRLPLSSHLRTTVLEECDPQRRGCRLWSGPARSARPAPTRSDGGPRGGPRPLNVPPIVLSCRRRAA